MYIHSWMVCHRPKSQVTLPVKPTSHDNRLQDAQRPTSVKNAA